MKAVFVGQCPASIEDQGDPLTLKNPSSSGSRLAGWMGVTPEEFSANFIRVNVNPHSEEEFSPGYWIPAARNLKGLLEHRRVVLLGRLVAESFELRQTDYQFFRWFDHPSDYETSLFCVIPHPSGRNRMYNDQQNIARVSDLLSTIWLLKKEHA